MVCKPFTSMRKTIAERRTDCVACCRMDHISIACLHPNPTKPQHYITHQSKYEQVRFTTEMKCWCFRPLLCTLFRLNWAKDSPQRKLRTMGTTSLTQNFSLVLFDSQTTENLHQSELACKVKGQGTKPILYHEQNASHLWMCAFYRIIVAPQQIWFPVVLCESWRVPHVGQEMLTLSRTPDFTPFGQFRLSPIHYIYITEFVSFRTMFMDELFWCAGLD